MEYETKYGLRREHTFDQVRKYITADPDTIKYPHRAALFLQKSHVYGQVEESMRSNTSAQAEQTNYRETDEQAPYVPPRPRQVEQPVPDAPMPDPDPDVTDEIMGPPPAPPAPPSAPMIRSATAQALAAEGIRPSPPPPDMAQLYASFNPPPPPPPPQAYAIAYPSTQPQSFGPVADAYAAYANPPAPPPGPSPARVAVQGLAHTAGHAAASSAGQALGTAAAAALLARSAGLGPRMGVEGGPAGVLLGAVAGTAAGVGQLAIHGLLNRGGAGGSSDPTPQAAGTISGFRQQGVRINQSNIAAQHRAHVSGDGTAAFREYIDAKWPE